MPFTEKLKKLSPISKTVIGLATFLGACGVIWTSYSKIKNNTEYNIDKYIKTQTKNILKEEKENNKTGYRYLKAEALGINIDSLLYYDKQIFAQYKKFKNSHRSIKALQKDKISLIRYLIHMSDFMWRELTLVQYKGVNLGKSNNNLIYYKYSGFIFEAYYKGSTDSYWFKDSYGNEMECIIQ